MQDVTTATTASKLPGLVEQMPKPDEKRGILSNADKAAADKAVAELHAGGRESVVGLVGMLAEPKQGEEQKDSQARHALHALVIHVGGLGDDGQRRALAEALASVILAPAGA